LVLCVSSHAWGQAMGMPPDAATPPSLQTNPKPPAANAFAGGGAPAPVTRAATNPGSLPQGNGQEHRVYDLRPYTGYLTKHDRPHQAVIDWIIRETGSDMWFTEPFGFMSADRDSLSVYHTPEMHDLVGRMVDRFVAGEKDPQVLHLRVMTVGSPNWRTRTHMLMQHVSVDSAGLQAWLLTKENAAIVLSMLRQRTDVREVQAVDMITHNGQTEKLASTRGRNYVQNIRQAPTGWPPYEPQTGEVQEGYRLEMSPLLSVDRRTIDCVIKANIDQVDKLVPVDLDLPLPSGEMYRARIEVPQVVSWRLNERFRWPTDMVLLLSCGVVASPERPTSSIPLLNLNSLTGTTAGRADALMFVEFRGRVNENLPAAAPQMADRTGAGNRGRY
ncbi:MAG: hypothetical protein ACO1RT_06115, partial [Planctomycetaceae bacterium]